MFQASFPEYDFSYEAGPIQEFHSQRKHGTPKRESFASTLWCGVDSRNQCIAILGCCTFNRFTSETNNFFKLLMK